jgi:hypothetical protein
MMAIYRGHRYYVVSSADEGVSLHSVGSPALRVQVSVDDPDLIFEPSCEDLHFAEAFERGEVGAFEYPDGHTYPPNQEIPKPLKRKDPKNVH